MQEQDSYCLESPLYDSTAFIPANYNYINFELSSEHLPNSPPESFIAPFQTHFATLSSLLQDLLSRNEFGKKYPLQRLKLTLKEGTPLKPEETLENLRLQLCRESASGVTVKGRAVYAEVNDEAAITYYIHSEPDFNPSTINKWFLLLNNQEPFFINIRKDAPPEKLEAAVCSSLNEFYHNAVASVHLKFFKIEKTKEDIVFSWKKIEALTSSQLRKDILESQRQITGVQVTKQGTEWPASQVSSEEYLIFHIENSRKIKLKFAQIVKYRVGELLQYLGLQHENALGIKIVDEIFPPSKMIREASRYFQTGEGKFVKNVECRLVCERQIFYSSLSRMGSEFQIPKDMVTQAKEKLYEECRDLAQRRITQLQQSNLSHFTDPDQISPITLYTSSVDIIDEKTKSYSLLYKGLNDFLRTNKFGLVEQYHGEWKYKYSATLIRSLQKIQPFREINPQTGKVTVFRGIRGHQLLGEEGELYVAKEFLSTSIDQKKAKRFMSNAEIGTFLEIECHSGRSISQFSIYEREKEVLFMPYSYFRIVQKDTSSPVFYMRLKEVQQPQFKSNPATVILWVDDKLAEGDKVISSLDCPMHTTFLHQLTSTKALEEWINENQRIVQNTAIKIAVISNMKRREDGEQVLDAGANTVKLVRRELPKSDIILYIYHVEGTENALRANGIDPVTVKIFNKRKQLKQYIAEWCKPLEQDESEEVISETKQSILSYFNSSECSVKKSHFSSSNSI